MNLKKSIRTILFYGVCLCFLLNSTPIQASILPYEEYQIGDVDGNEEINLDDAKLALSAALGIENLSEKSFYAANLEGKKSITLKDANSILKVALGIESIETVANQDAVLSELDMKDAYLKVFNKMSFDQPMDFLVVNTASLEYLSEQEKEEILSALKDIYDVEIYVAESVEEIKEQGLITGSANGSWSMDGYWMFIDDVKMANGDLVIDGGRLKGGLHGASYRWVLKDNGSDWEIISKETIMVS